MRTETELGHVSRLQAQKLDGHLVVYGIFFTVIALGVVIGFSFLVPSSSVGNEMLYLATGTPMIVLIMTALAVVPTQNVAARVAGYTDFIKSLSVSRKDLLFANCTVWLLITVPAIVISIIIAHFMFHPGFPVSWTITPTYVLVMMACFGIGYGYLCAMPAELAMGLSQIIAFVVLMFTPISSPVDRLPEWLQVVHLALPLHRMAQVVRASLAHETFQVGIVSYVVLAVWSVLGFFATIRILERD